MAKGLSVGSKRDDCQYPRCRRESDLIYLGRGVCMEHWNLICENEELKLTWLGSAPQGVNRD